MKTAMSKLEEKLENLWAESDIITIESLLDYIHDVGKPNEKEQIIDFAIGAYQDISRMKGVSENLISENKILFEDYYNQTYNNERIDTNNDRVY